MPNPPHSSTLLEQPPLLMLRQQCSESQGGENGEWLELSLLLFFGQSALPPLFFSSGLSNISLQLLPSFSSQPWQSTQIPTAWDKEGEKRQKDSERWWDTSVSVTWPLGTKGDNTARVCASLLKCDMSLCGGVCLFTLFLSGQEFSAADVSLLSSTGGLRGGGCWRGHKERWSEKQMIEEFDRGNIKNMGFLERMKEGKRKEKGGTQL